MDIIASYLVYNIHDYYGERANAVKKVIDKIITVTSETYELVEPSLTLWVWMR